MVILHNIFRILTVLISVLLISACESSIKLPDPKIDQCTTKVSGTLIDERGEHNSFSLTIYYPITATNKTYDINLNDNGHFNIVIPLETNFAVAFIYVGGCKSILLGLVGDQESVLEITYDKTGNEQIKVSDKFPLSPYDMANSSLVMGNMIEGNHPFRKRAPEEYLYEKGPDYYVQYADQILIHRQEIAEADTFLSRPAKQILKNEFKLFLANNWLFNYNEMMFVNFINTKPEVKPDDYLAPPTPERSYYAFLKSINLNDPCLLYSSEYPNIVQNILNNEIIGLPPISDTPIDEWLKEVKRVLADLVGFEEGLFYDVLVSNAYARQFNNRLIPLSEKQKQNVEFYFKNGEIGKILLKKNEEIVKLNTNKSELVINAPLQILNENLIETITSKHKGKIIIVDFWATWCTPCLQAMIKFRDTKSQYSKEDIAFVYLTNASSPQKLWKEKIEGIGGEHYYLEDSQWKYLMTEFDFDAIPSYLIYDKNGTLKNKFTGYPGNDKMKEMIDELICNS